MSAKYYTPTIEEFHVGFECQRQNSELLAIEFDRQIELKHISYIDYEIKADLIFAPHLIRAIDIQIYTLNPHLLYEIRVKHLDREDIESLGFNIETTFNYQKPKLIIYERQVNDLDWLKIVYETETQKTTIEDIEGYMFIGTIKNKSELKKLMKQLNIKTE